MATSAKFMNDLLKNIDDQQLEIFCIIWLDDNTQTSDNRDTEQHLRSIINRLKRFKDVEQCENYINQRSLEDRLILIVSGRLGRKIVPTIHTVRQVISIYVYCMDEAGNKEWSKKYTKVTIFWMILISFYTCLFIIYRSKLLSLNWINSFLELKPTIKFNKLLNNHYQ
jgi:hypothetical protein